MTNRLFVYGTLRQDGWNSMSHMLARDARFVGYARLEGRIYRLGEYPGLVPSRDPGCWVHGEVYALENPPETLARLDNYEGCGPDDPAPHEFERAEHTVVLESGVEDNVWVYVYKGSIRNKPEILSGDYFKEAF